MKIKVVSRDTIKPSSPTPDHLHHYKLSFLDQLAPPVFMPLVLFYPKVPHLSNKDQSDHLKQHLAHALTIFYPLAGRVVGDAYVDCSDEGVPYVVARANCDLSEVISDPVPGEMNAFLAYKLDDVKDLPMAIQTTFFDCGGMAVSVLISHKIADALSFIMFINSWAAVARGDKDIPVPRFESSNLFPPRDTTKYKATTGMIKENIVTRRILFTASKVASLRDRFTNTGCEKRPTRIEALSAFIWSRFLATTQAETDRVDKIFMVLHAVNLRARMDPPLLNESFGNLSRVAMAIPSLEGDTMAEVREAIKRVDVGYVSNLRDGEEHLDVLEEAAEKFNSGKLVPFNFTSLCRFPLYEADFGWGKPVWVGSASLTFKNLVVFMDRPSGGGIEVWINLKEEDMMKFEVDSELLSFALSPKELDTSPF